MSQQLTTFRLSPQQGRLVADAPDGVCSCAVQLAEPLDEAAVLARLASLAERHEILRTTLVRPAGMSVPAQRVDDVGGPLVVDVSVADGVLHLSAPAANLDPRSLLLLAEGLDG